MILPAGRGGDSFIEERVLPDPDETEGQSSERICRSKATKIDRAAGHTFVERLDKQPGVAPPEPWGGVAREAGGARYKRPEESPLEI